MKSKIVQLIFLLYYIAAGTSDFASATTPFVDPGIPHGETITYTSRAGDKLTTIVENVLIKSDKKRKLYEITSRSDPLDKTITLVKDTMSIVSAHTVRKYHDVTLDLQLTVIDERPHPAVDEVKLADFSALNYILRGFPFGKLKKIKIGFYGEERKKKYGFNVSFKKREKIMANGKTIECYKLELGMEGFWGSFIPNTSMWYSVESPHYLVRYEGSSGPPGSPKRVIELSTYTVMESSH